MKKFLIASVATLALSAGSAFAADMGMPLKAPPPPPPAFSWTGFYIGLNAGYGWGRTDDDVNYLPSAAAFGVNPFTASANMGGGFGGGQIGYNAQLNPTIVAGIEADFDGSHISGSPFAGPLSPFGGGAFPLFTFHSANQTVDEFGTVRGRLGYLVTPQLLLYATGGLGYGDIATNSFTSLNPVPPSQYAESSTAWRAGWTAGGGAEWAIADGWSIKAEYLHLDFGHQDLLALPLAANPPYAVTNHWTTSIDIVRAGLNYNFNFGGPIATRD
jgi:outer membrane immunogenic protein